MLGTPARRIRCYAAIVGCLLCGCAAPVRLSKAFCSPPQRAALLEQVKAEVALENQDLQLLADSLLHDGPHKP